MNIILQKLKIVNTTQNQSLVAGRRLLFVLLVTGCWLLVASSAHAAVLFFNPQNEIVVEDGQSVIVEARLDTEGKSINAIDAIFGFPQNLLEVADISQGDSVITLWIQAPQIDNEAGTVQFIGGIPNGGSFAAGLIARITFRAKAAGTGTLAWSDTSQVLLNDGAGTPAEVSILATPLRATPASADVPTVFSQTHPDETQWYRSQNLFLNWDLDPNMVYSYMLDHDPASIPDEAPDEPKGDLRFAGTIKYENLSDGIYYFHLRQAKQEAAKFAWGRTRTFRAQIDTVSPEHLEAEVGSDETVYGGRWFAAFSGQDTMAGIARYDVSENSSEWVKDARAPYELKNQDPGSMARIRAVDKAGNESEKTITVPRREKPQPLTLAIIILVIVACIVGAIFYVRRGGFAKPV